MDVPTILTQEQRLTMSFEEFLNFGDELTRAEWVNGEVIIFMNPTVRHQRIVGLLYKVLSIFADAFKLGEVIISPMGMRLSNSYRQPDVIFVAQANLDRLGELYVDGPADLAVEVISPSSTRRDRVEKLAEYAAEGVREYWVIDPRPDHQTADFYHLTDAGTYRAARLDDDGRFHSAVLPGFWLDPDWLRQAPLPGSLELLRQISPDVL